jgi:benzoate-CoA ligase
MITLPEWYNTSLIIDRNLEAGRADKVAIYCGDDRVTYGELARRINRFGHALKSLGVNQEDRVLLVLNDTPALPTAFFGAIRIGVVPIPVNTLLRGDDYRFFVENSRSRAVVTDLMHYEKVRDGLEGYADRVEFIVSNGSAEGRITLEELLESGEDELAPAKTHKDDPAFWIYSSGSTGKPKGAVHLQHDILYTCESYARHVLKINESDTVFSASKLFHAYGMGGGMTFPYWAGSSSVLFPGRQSPQIVLETIQRYQPTLFFTVPTLYEAILDYPDATSYDLSSVRLCVSAAEALPPGVWRRWKETFGSTILDGIGSTEMLQTFISNTLDALKPGSSGRPVPGYDVRLLNEEGFPVGPGEEGYLSVRGDSAAAYYWRNHEKTKSTMRGEWLFTGDRYRVDEDGFYWYEGRADDMIKVGGLWVSPVEVESTLLDHPTVMEAAVVGVTVGGLTRIKAYAVLRTGQTGSQALAKELQNWCKDRLKRYQFPQIVDFVEDLPKTATGKIQRYRLREPEIGVGSRPPTR